MSWASVTLTIVFALNLLVFLSGQPEANSPMLGVLKGVMTGNFNIDWGQIFTWNKLLQIGIITVLVLAVSTALSPATAVTGSFSTVHVLTIIGICFFISFVALPNFSFMGLPYLLSNILNIFIGFMVVMSIIGFMRGE